MTDYFDIAKQILTSPYAAFDVVCAWCGKTLEHKSPVEHTHGMCQACHDRMMAEAKTLDAAPNPGRGVL